MAVKGDGFDLAKAMSNQVLTNLLSFLPCKIKENEALCERYERMYDKVVATDFVTKARDGWVFNSGFSFADFGDELYLQLLEMSVVWNASPFSVAKALVVLPAMIEAAVKKLTSESGGVDQASKNIARSYQEICKKKQAQRGFDYDEEGVRKA